MKKIIFILILLLTATISFSQTILLNENFDGATMPSDWFANYSTGNGTQIWTFGSGVTPGGSIADFPTNAAIFDDDGAGDTGNHDSVWLWYGLAGGVAGIDVTTYGQVTLSYDYALNVLGTSVGESLSVGLWDGAVFVPMKVYDTDTDPTTDSIDITAFLNAHPGVFDPSNIFIGFGYDDGGGNWGWGAGVDNVLLIGSVQPANDDIFVHTATAANIVVGYQTVIDHPDLNGNPDAKIVVSHNWNIFGSGVYNNNIDAVWYDSGLSRWVIYNEDVSAPIPVGAKYNVYIRGNDSNVITHIATTDNQGTSPRYTIIDNPLINGNPNAILIMENYYNPNAIYNNNNYGFWYDGTNWEIYSEDATLSTIPIGAAFNVIISSSNNNVTSLTHTATAANTTGNYTTIDSPLLNNKPNAVFVFSHNWGVSGDASNIVLDKVLGCFYGAGKWRIYTEDQSIMLADLKFNIMIKTTEVAAVNSTDLVRFTIYPNPVQDILNIETEEKITKVSIFNVLGQEVKTIQPTSININLDVSDLDKGIYTIKLFLNGKETFEKFIKK